MNEKLSDIVLSWIIFFILFGCVGYTFFGTGIMDPIKLCTAGICSVLVVGMCFLMGSKK